MNKKLILLGSVGVAAIAITTISGNPDSNGVYSSRVSEPSSQETPSIEGAFDLYHTLKGDYTKEDWLRAKYQAESMPQDRTTFTWVEQGPDNVGGRTRAILVDNQNIHHVYAGSVSGGLFESNNRGNEWHRIDNFYDNLGISSMCQTPDGTLYIATGHSAEESFGYAGTGYNGDGVFKQNTDGTFTQVTGTSGFQFINEVVADTLNNIVWMATNSGLRKYDPSTDILTSISTSTGISSGSCSALAISPDGGIIVAGMSGGKTNISLDGGVTFENRSGGTAGLIEPGAGRVEYAISHEKDVDGNYHVYASLANTHLVGIWRSADNGYTWTEIAPAGNGSPGTFSPFSHSTTSGQGTYDNIISVQRGNPDRIFVGGIDVYSWNLGGNWNQMSLWNYEPWDDQYVHADQHEQVWDKWGRLYVGNDGGISYSDDGGQTFVQANRGYNVTQYYFIGYSAHGDVIGGAQDNGTTANYHNNETYRSFEKIMGGDGFSASISFINRNILFGSVYYAGVMRSADRGTNSFDFTPPQWTTCEAGNSDGTGCGSFYTNFKTWEHPMDLNSTDSINYISSQAYQTGDTVEVPSRTTGVFIHHIATADIVFDDTLHFNPALTTFDTTITSVAPANEYNLSILEHYEWWDAAPGGAPIDNGDSIYIVPLDTIVKVASYSLTNHYYGTNPLKPGKVHDMSNDDEVYNICWDTIRVQDHYQSWLAIGLSGTGDPSGIFMTRNALRFSADDAEWFQVADGYSGDVMAMEYSRDGNHLFVGTSSGQLWRLSGFGDVYSPAVGDSTLEWDFGHSATTWTNISNGGTSFSAPITGIAVDGDVDHVVITLAGTGSFSSSSSVRECTNATGGSPTWTNIHGDLPSMPYYSVLINRDNPNHIIVGGEFGVFSTETGGSPWADISGIVGHVPVHDMGQNWRQFDEGCIKTGQIYIGTHGRGIWTTDAYLSIPGDQDNLAIEKFIPNIVVYPNPLNEVGNLQFDLTENSDVYIQIFNLSGQLVQEISKSNMTQGKNTVTFETGNLPGGTYIVRLKAGSLTETTKFIKH